MLVWINGTFGVGKSRTAFELHQRLPGSALLDPEQIGYALRRITPRSIWPEDFQALPQWRSAVREHVQWTASTFDGVLIVPMTLLEPAWHDEIVGGLRRAGTSLQHFTLTASDAAIHARLGKRGDRGDAWALARLARYGPLLTDEQFAEHIATDDMPVARVAEHIAERAGLRIGAPLPAMSARWQRLRSRLGKPR